MPNPALEKLGFAPDARVVIVHADDVGMCHAANVAFWEDQAFGVVTCGSVMMPCSWAPEMAAWCRTHPEADVGVHITLNSEWDSYRWRPLSTGDPKSGLIDDEGYMWRSVEEFNRHMDPDAAIVEMRAQVETALALGIDVTHIDTHMGTVMHPQLLPAYAQLALEYRLPAMLPRIPKERMAEWGIDPAVGEGFLVQMDHLAAGGFPILDMILAVREQGNPLEVYQRLFDQVPQGITHLLLHPSVPGHDIEAITASAAERIADYETFLAPELKKYVLGQGIHLIGYRRLRDLIRGEL
jgi:predicted glycoside hydrolase/deacetylase ChbG (UPF0249 family)